jgi:hypothetical protein
VLYYVHVIRPVLEYACPVWHSGLTTEQTDLLENVQKRALRIIYGDCFASATYCDYCCEIDILTLADRRQRLSHKFFQKMRHPSCCIHHLVPEKRDESLRSRLRNSFQYQVPFARTEKYKKSFIVFALRNFQTDIC